MGLVYKICPRCFQGRPYDEACKTPACVELQKSPTYLRDEIEGQLHIAKTLLAEGNKEEDWAAVVKKLEKELMLYCRFSEGRDPGLRKFSKPFPPQG